MTGVQTCALPIFKVRDKVKLNLNVTTKLKKLLEYKANIERIEQRLSIETELASMSEIKVESLRAGICWSFMFFLCGRIDPNPASYPDC